MIFKICRNFLACKKIVIFMTHVMMNAELKKPMFPNPVMFSLFMVYWIAGILILFLTSQGDPLLWVNSFSTDTLDHFFLVVTFLGNGIFAAILAIAFFFKKLYYGLSMTAAFIVVSLLTNFFKRLVFIQHYRPLWFFYYNDLHRVIIDAPVNYLRSFPSGHAMTAFAMATILSILFRKHWLSVLFFIGAFLISWSRVYLCQHFFIDIFWGGLLGFFSAIIGKVLMDGLVKLFNTDVMAMPIQKVLPVLLSRVKH